MAGRIASGVRGDIAATAPPVNGAPLHIQHGYPVRLIGPNRPGVQQTKWLAKVVIS